MQTLVLSKRIVLQLFLESTIHTPFLLFFFPFSFTSCSSTLKTQYVVFLLLSFFVLRNWASLFGREKQKEMLLLLFA